VAAPVSLFQRNAAGAIFVPNAGKRPGPNLRLDARFAPAFSAAISSGPQRPSHIAQSASGQSIRRKNWLHAFAKGRVGDIPIFRRALAFVQLAHAFPHNLRCLAREIGNKAAQSRSRPILSPPSSMRAWENFSSHRACAATPKACMIRSLLA